MSEIRRERENGTKKKTSSCQEILYAKKGEAGKGEAQEGRG